MAKQNTEGRHERHLMRQRGAGARILTTNFGFTFNATKQIIPIATNPKTPAKTPAKVRSKTASKTPVRTPARSPSRASTRPVAKESRIPATRGRTLQPKPSIEEEAIAPIQQATEDPITSSKPRVKRRRLSFSPGVDVRVPHRKTHVSQPQPAPELETVQPIKDLIMDMDEPMPPAEDLDLEPELEEKDAPVLVKSKRKAPRKKRKPVTMPKKKKAPARSRATAQEVGTSGRSKAAEQAKEDVEENMAIVPPRTTKRKRDKDTEDLEKKKEVPSVQGKRSAVTKETSKVATNTGTVGKATSDSKIRPTSKNQPKLSKKWTAPEVVENSASGPTSRTPLSKKDSNKSTSSPDKGQPKTVVEETIAVTEIVASPRRPKSTRRPVSSKQSTKEVATSGAKQDEVKAEEVQTQTRTPARVGVKISKQRKLFSIKDLDDDGEVWFRPGKRKGRA